MNMNHKMLGGEPDQLNPEAIKYAKRKILEGLGQGKLLNSEIEDLAFEVLQLKVRKPVRKEKELTLKEIVYSFTRDDGKGYPKIQNARKGKKLLKALGSGEKSKVDLKKMTGSKASNIRGLIRDTNKLLEGSIINFDMKIISCKDLGRPGFYRIDISQQKRKNSL